MTKPERVISIGLLVGCLTACDSSPAVQPVEPAPVELTAGVMETSSQPTAERTLRLWSRSCVLCHVTGNGGAPRLGNEAEWATRLAQGEAVLLKHTIEGLNNMPPLGYCMACEREDLVAIIEFMTAPVAAGDSASESLGRTP